MDLKVLVKRLNEFAHKDLACDWDNVGLLVEPTDPVKVKKFLVTNDLTESVLEEAIELNVDLIVSYHPAIFKPLKRLTQAEWKQRSIIKCIEKHIAVFSPHTTWDSVDGGMNDWILKSFGPKSIEPVNTIQSTTYPTGFGKNVKINLNQNEVKTKFLDAIKSFDQIKFISEKEIKGLDTKTNVSEIEFVCSPNGVINLMDTLIAHYDANVLNTLRVYDLDKPNIKNAGLGRFGVLNEPTTVSAVIEQLKKLIKQKHLRLALGNGKSLDDKVNSIAVGAGCGSKILNNTNADLIITGEFSHHEILHETHRGVSLILTDHTNTERCWFQYFKQQFTELLKKNNESVEIVISTVDRDPLVYV